MWIWIGNAVAVLVALILYWRYTAKKWRKTRRQEILAYFAEYAPEFNVSEIDALSLQVAVDGRNHSVFNLHNVYKQLAEVARNDKEGLNGIYQKMVDTVRESLAAEEVVPERDLPIVFPRIVTDEMMASLNAQSDAPISIHPLGLVGFWIVFVLNRAVSVQYINDNTLKELGLAIDDALELAKKNLRKNWSCEGVRGAVEHQNVAVIKSEDTFDAARLLLVPECLHDRETVVALIPDRDSLLLAPSPPEGEWQAYYKLAIEWVGGQPLCQRPIVVTNVGFRFAGS